jgi:hypothetical protein
MEVNSAHTLRVMDRYLQSEKGSKIFVRKVVKSYKNIRRHKSEDPRTCYSNLYCSQLQTCFIIIIIIFIINIQPEIEGKILTQPRETAEAFVPYFNVQ